MQLKVRMDQRAATRGHCVPPAGARWLAGGQLRGLRERHACMC